MKTIRKIAVLSLISVCLSVGFTLLHRGVHASFSEWKYDTDSHWQVCACGEKDVSSSHTWDTEGICTICKGSCFDGAFETATTEEMQVFSDKLIRGKSWYADGCIYVQEETEMSNSEKYRQEADFDFFSAIRQDVMAICGYDDDHAVVEGRLLRSGHITALR